MQKVVQINTVYNVSSTGKIVAAIESISKENEIDMYVACGRGKKDNNPKHLRIGNNVDFFSHVVCNFLGYNGFASKRVTQKFLKWLDEIKPDLIHLHNIHGFFINIEMLFQYIKEKNIPVIWTLHDCWPFTGHCAYFDYVNCDKWKEQCYKCPIYRSDYPYSIFVDNSRKNYIRKRTAFTSVRDMVIVTPSEWLSQKVKESFLGNYETRVINNGIDLEIFKAIEREEKLDSKIILAVANIWDKRKGLKFVLGLSEWYNHENGYKIVIIGLNRNQIRKIKSIYDEVDVLPIQRTKNQRELVEWYNKATVLVNPTLQDNYPTTNLESVACGTSVVTFETGGSPETIDETCGIVVNKSDIDMLRDAVKMIAEGDKEEQMKKCIAKSMEYDKKVCFEKYMGLYKELLCR